MVGKEMVWSRLIGFEDDTGHHTIWGILTPEDVPIVKCDYEDELSTVIGQDRQVH